MTNTPKQDAYEAGQNAGYSNKVFQNPYSGQPELWDAFTDGFEDGRDQYACEAAA